MKTMRLDSATIITKEQIMKFCKDNNIEKEDIIDLCISKGMKYGIRYDVAFSLCLLYTNFFKDEVKDYNIAGLGLQMGYNIHEKFESYDECLEVLFQMLKRFSDQGFICECDHEIYKLIDEFNEEFSKPQGFAGTINTLEELCPIWNSNMKGVKATSIEEFVYLMIQSFLAYKVTTIDFTNDRDISFYVRIESHTDLPGAHRLKRKIESFPFIKHKIPVHVNNTTSTTGKGCYCVDVGDFKYRGLAEGCQHNLKRFGYYGRVLYKPSKTMLAKLEKMSQNEEENY